jgi:hypothetical protein
MRVQAEKLKPKNDIQKSVRVEEEPKIPFQCSTRFCNRQDPSSDILCEKCISAMCVPINPSVPPYPSPNIADSLPMKIGQIQPYKTEWRCEYCNHQNNLSSNERCIYCQQGHRPQQITSPSTKIYKPPRPRISHRWPEYGNLLFQSAFFSGRV